MSVAHLIHGRKLIPFVEEERKGSFIRMNIGIDIASLKKFKRIKSSDFKHWRRVFTACEWKYAFSAGGKSAERLAGIFAAKEAAMKAFGKVGVKNFREFEISHTPSGAPKLNKPSPFGKEPGKPRSRVSIAHNQDTAIAVVLKT